MDKPGSPDDRFSPSARSALQAIGDGSVEASAVVQALLKLHGEYGSGMARSLSLQPTGGVTMTAGEWGAEVTRWVDARRFDGDLIHGRLMIIALAGLDEVLRKQLEEAGFLRNLYEEVGGPVASSELMTDAERDSAGETSSKLTASEPEAHAVGILDDDAAKKDLLRRRPFARYLARALRNIRRDLVAEGRPGSFILHIDGPWGSGKTSLLGFLRDHLATPEDRDEQRWIIVEYNAWSHQHEDPPWWQLREQVVQTIIANAAGIQKWRLRFGEWWWRFWTSVKPVAVAASVFAALVAGLVIVAGRSNFFGLGTGDSSGGDFLTEASRFIAVFAALWGVAVAAGRKLAPSSQGGAKRFLESERNPLGVLRTRFDDIVTRAGSPVAIFIDDLDRCRGDSVVGLIEGIQTLFRTTSIIYVVASDRRWVEASFDRHYRELGDRVGEPGRSVGHLFLQKSFQVSVELPPITNAGTFWAGLIDGDRRPRPERPDAPTNARRIRNTLKEAKSPGANEARLEAARTSEPDLYHLWVIEALDRELDDDVRRVAEHELRDFHPLLDRNPRVMKRFVNAYGIHRAAVMYSDALIGLPIDQPWKQLGLWTVIQMRWPALAEVLISDPSLIRIASDEKPLPPDHELDEHPRGALIRLLDDPKVKQVVKADQVGAVLDQAAVRAFYGLPQVARPPVA